MYDVLHGRRGHVESEDVRDGTNIFLVTSYLPVESSFGFASEIRKKTGGQASPQLLLSHWEVIPVDPNYVARTEEELEESGLNEEGRNVARELIDNVRRRKGLPVNEKVVEHAEKHRTLARKK
jgi:ribosome assembly protein 1